ncbi:hypothetical protein [Chitiniphilus shinanonensis]|uniref:hypothetical protein n=1 Tax=Chitiniphilus shinanonensis TaxID=553088 RepID=UPI003021B77B
MDRPGADLYAGRWGADDVGGAGGVGGVMPLALMRCKAGPDAFAFFFGCLNTAASAQIGEKIKQGKEMNKAGVVAIVAGVGLCVAIAKWGGPITMGIQESQMMREAAKRDEQTMEMIRIEVEETNKRMPMKLNDALRAEKAIAGPGKKIEYVYTLAKDRSYYFSAEELKATFSTTQTNAICSSDINVDIIRRGAEMKFSYYYNDGNLAFSYSINSIKACAGIDEKIEMRDLIQGAKRLDSKAEAELKEKVAEVNKGMPYEIGDGITVLTAMDAGSRVLMVMALADAETQKSPKQIEAYQNKINDFVCNKLRLKFKSVKGMDFRSMLYNNAGHSLMVLATDPEKDCAS